jgi:hypothetical protein
MLQHLCTLGNGAPEREAAGIVQVRATLLIVMHIGRLACFAIELANRVNVVCGLHPPACRERRFVNIAIIDRGALAPAIKRRTHAASACVGSLPDTLAVLGKKGQIRGPSPLCVAQDFKAARKQ